MRSLGTILNFSNFHRFITVKTSLKTLSATDVIVKQLPPLVFYVSLIDTFTKENVAGPRPSTVEFKDVAVSLRCYSQHGVFIDSGIYDGESVFGFVSKHPKRYIFISSK